MSSIHSNMTPAHYALAAAATAAVASPSSSPTTFLEKNLCHDCIKRETQRVEDEETSHSIELSEIREKVRQSSVKIPSQKEIFAIFDKNFPTEEDIIQVGCYLQNRENVNASIENITLLHKASCSIKESEEEPEIRQSFKAIFDLFLSTNAIDLDSFLIAAIDLHLSDVTKQLIAQDADIAVRTHDGQTPLHLACHNKCPDIVYAILDRAAAIETAVHDALKMQLSTELIRLIWDLNSLCIAETDQKSTPLNELTTAQLPVTDEPEFGFTVKELPAAEFHEQLSRALWGSNDDYYSDPYDQDGDLDENRHDEEHHHNRNIVDVVTCATAILSHSKTTCHARKSGDENYRALEITLTDDHATLDQVWSAAKACSSEISLDLLNYVKIPSEHWEQAILRLIQANKKHNS